MSTTPSRIHGAPRSKLMSTVRALALVAALAATAFTQSVGAQTTLRRSLPSALSDAEFWQFFTTMSESSGSFPSENFVSNEVDFQQVIIPTLKRTTTPGGVYLGVGPEQNFTYITNLSPGMAVIFDIRRQNAMAHLMYKALFEMSPTRAEFASHLFSRPLTTPPPTGATAEQLFTAVVSAPASDSAYDANLNAILTRLTITHHFDLPVEDRETIRRVYRVFFLAGPAVNYSYRSIQAASGDSATGSAAYATFAGLQSATSVDSVNMAFLASEENYQRIREMERKNLIVPVVGDFSGPKAVRAVGQYLKDHNAAVMAFYLSNVEQYLFQNGVASQFYQNVATLPLDSTSTFIRSVTRGAGSMLGISAITYLGGVGGGTIVTSGTGVTRYKISMVDSGGVRVIRTTTDSAGQPVIRTTIDSTKGVATRSVIPNFPIPFPAQPPGTPSSVVRAINGGSLTSGIASIMATLAAFNAGQLVSWQNVIAMTKTTGWK